MPETVLWANPSSLLRSFRLSPSDSTNTCIALCCGPVRPPLSISASMGRLIICRTARRSRSSSLAMLESFGLDISCEPSYQTRRVRYVVYEIFSVGWRPLSRGFLAPDGLPTDLVLQQRPDPANRNL